jgi:hypothetical protein
MAGGLREASAGLVTTRQMLERHGIYSDAERVSKLDFGQKSWLLPFAINVLYVQLLP